mmetsp:Transcript_9251/g.24200  ORF Transcript_9251/g.24200 Transcript_9251/m.24200 type:complete len:475 (-) Transcript_9251:813-2237(-)
MTGSSCSSLTSMLAAPTSCGRCIGIWHVLGHMTIGRSSDGFSTNDRSGSLASQASWLPAGAGAEPTDSSDANISSMPSCCIDELSTSPLPFIGVSVAIEDVLAPSCDRSNSRGATPTPGGKDGAAGGGALAEVSKPPNAPKSSCMEAAPGGAASVAGGAGVEVKAPNGSSPPKVLPIGMGSIVGIVAEAAAKGSCVGIEPTAAGASLGDPIDCIFDAAGGGDSRACDTVASWSLGGIPRECSSPCSTTESTQGRASMAALSGACQIETCHGGCSLLGACCESITSSVGQPVTPVVGPHDSGSTRCSTSTAACLSRWASEPSIALAGINVDEVAAAGEASSSAGGACAEAELNSSKSSVPATPPESKSPKSSSSSPACFDVASAKPPKSSSSSAVGSAGAPSALGVSTKSPNSSSFARAGSVAGVKPPNPSSSSSSSSSPNTSSLEGAAAGLLSAKPPNSSASSPATTSEVRAPG